MVELVFNPQSAAEVKVSQFFRFMHPYLAFFTYRFHVEKARDAGIRIDDFYNQKFHKEPYIMNHIYAQNFHPWTLLERVKDTCFLRRPRMLFKGFNVPDWATAQNRHGWEVDHYSRTAWDNAMHEFNSEWTPMQFFGERHEPNIIQWFRLEQAGKGNSSRLYYNEVPNPTWYRHGGHLENKEDALWSFTHGDSETPMLFGIDTTTPEGREAFKKEWEIMHKIAPEIVKKETFVFPHEIRDSIPTEPHFQRMWKFYQKHTMLEALDKVVAEGHLSQEDSDAAVKFFGGRKSLSIISFVLGKSGHRPDLHDDEGYKAADRAMTAIGMNQIKINLKSAEPYCQQFWHNFDGLFNLTHKGLKQAMPQLVSGSHDRAKVEALFNEHLE